MMWCRVVLIATILILVGISNGLNAENESRLKKFRTMLAMADSGSPNSLQGKSLRNLNEAAKADEGPAKDDAAEDTDTGKDTETDLAAAYVEDGVAADAKDGKAKNATDDEAAEAKDD